MSYFDVVVGTIQSVATVGALYYAWKTVREARAASAEEREERRARRLADIIETASELDLFVRNSNNYRAEQAQAHLRALLVGIDLDLPRARELAAAPLERLDDLLAAQHLGEGVLDEVRAASEAPLETYGP